MIKGLVSIVVPCYNREKILYRFLDSVLEQTYKHIQLILIDDGSTDQTAAVIDAYRSKFETAGIELEYYYQENGGVSHAINHGLRYVKGEFLCWPDSDDWYDKDSLLKRVEFLNRHPQYGIVSCDADFFYENDMTTVRGFVSGKMPERLQEEQFKLLLRGRSLICPICHMARTEAFWATHPNHEIYESRHGQNIQMLLPVYYKYKRGFIDEVLCHYLVMDKSLSRSADTFERALEYRNEIETLTIETLKRIDMPTKKKNKYIRFARVRNTRRRLKLAEKYQNKQLAAQQISKLYHLRAIGISDLLKYLKIKRT